jgi:hypothetical protein
MGSDAHLLAYVKMTTFEAEILIFVPNMYLKMKDNGIICSYCVCGKIILSNC